VSGGLQVARRQEFLPWFAPPHTFLRELSGNDLSQLCSALGVENRTDDPADPAPGQIWLRIDLQTPDEKRRAMSRENHRKTPFVISLEFMFYILDIVGGHKARVSFERHHHPQILFQ